MDWERILAETLVKPHDHDGIVCYRMDCAQTELEADYADAQPTR
jgi:hypothetical protein